MNTDTAANVRRIVARDFGVSLDRIVDDVHFRDLGADWLDRLEFLIVIENKISELRTNDLVVDHIDTVGELLRALELSSADFVAA